MGYLKEKTGWDIGDPIWSLSNVAEKTFKGVVSAIESVAKVAEGILNDPLPTLLQYGGAMIGIPPYVTSAVITAARGGNLEDVAKSAALSYGASKFMSSTGIGKEIGKLTQKAGDFTSSMMKDFNLPADTAIAVSTAATASLNSSIIGGINAAISGKNVTDGITSGFTSGLIYSSTNSYFDSLSKDPNWGFTPKSLELMKGASSSALNSIVSGNGDPAQAVGNYITSAFLDMGKTTLKKAADDAYTNLTTDTDAAKLAQDKFNAAKAEYDDKAAKGEALRKEINADSAGYQKTIDEQYNPVKSQFEKLASEKTEFINAYNAQKKVYDDNMASVNNYDAIKGSYGGRYEYDYSQENPQLVWVSNAPSKLDFQNAATAAATAANAAGKNFESVQTSEQKLYDDNKGMLDGLTSAKALLDGKVAKFQAIKTDIEDPTIAGSTAAALKATSDVYQTKYDAWAKTKDAADRSAESYTKAMAEVATRNATIDALNTGVIKVKGKDAENNWILDNGVTLTTQGKFIQDGQQLFTNAVGVPQTAMDFTASDGSNVDFNAEAGRVLSQTDVANICKRDYGFEPTPEEIDRLSGTSYTATGNQDITALADQKATAAYRSVTGTDPTEDELAAIKKTNNVVGSAISLAKTGDADPWGNLEGAMLKAAEGEPVKFTDAQMTDMVNRQLIFDGSDYRTKQDAANEARYKGFTQFLYDNSVHTMQPGGPTEKAVFQSVIDMQPTKGAAFNAARDLLGSNQVFDYKGSKLTTVTAEEQNARMQEAAYNDPSRALDNFYSGNIRYTGYDVAGDIAGKTRLSAPAQTIVDQMIATGATALGDQLVTLAAGVSLASGSPLQNVASNLGDYLIKYGQDKNGLDLVRQEENLAKQWKGAEKLSFFDQPGAIATAIKENPLGYISYLGKEGFQEGLPLIAGAIAGSTALLFGAPIATVGTIVAGTSALLNGWESFGAGGKEAYDLAIKGGASESEAREKGVLNGSIFAAITIPLEFIGDKAIVGSYFRGAKGSLIEYAKKFGSTVAVNAATEFIETVPQNLTTRASVVGWDNLTQQDALSATAAGFAAVSISAGVTTGLITPAAINETISIAKDYSGNDVSLGDFLSGKKTADLSTLKADAVLGADSSGKNITFGDAIVNNDYLKIDPTFFDDFLPTSFVDPLITDDAEARQIAESLGYTNPSPEVLKSLTGPISEADAQAKLDEFLSGMTAYEAGKPISAAEAQEMMKDLGLTGLSDADAISLATKIVQSVPADKLAPDPNIKLASDAGFPDVASYTQYGGDKAAYDKVQTDNANAQIATAAGFPDFATYTQYGGDAGAYNTAKTNDANTKTATDAGFPDFAAYTQYGGDVNAYNTAKTDAANLATAQAAGFPNYASYTQFNGDVSAYNKVNEDAANIRTATEAGFPDYATFLQYGGNVSEYTAAKTAETNKKTATEAGFPDFATYTQYSGDKTSYTAAVTAAANTKQAAEAGFPDFATYTKFNGDKAAYDASLVVATTTGGTTTTTGGTVTTDAVTKAINDAIANIKFPAGITPADVTSAIKTYMAENPGLSLAEVAGKITESTKGLATDTSVQNAISTALKGVATTADVNAAIAGIKFPAGITAADVAEQVKSALAVNPSLTVPDVTAAITAYMKANPGLSAADVKSAIDTSTKDLASKKDIEAAISAIKFPAGITPADVTLAIGNYMKANPGLSIQQVADAIASGTSGLATDAGVKKSISDALKGVATGADVQAKYDALTADQKATADALKAQGVATEAAIAQASATAATQIGNLSADVKAKYDTLTQAQKDAVAGQVQQGKDLTKAINDSATGLQANINALSGTVKTQYDSLTQAQKDVVASQVQQGKDLTKAIADSASGLQTQITGLSKDSQAKYDALNQGQKDIVAAQAKQGVDINAAITEASKLATQQVTDVKADVGKLTTDVQTKYDLLDQGQKDIVASQVKLGVDVDKAIDDAAKSTTQQITNVKTDLSKDIGDVQTQFNTRVDDLVNQGQTYQLATQTALGEIKATQAAEATKAAAAAKAGRAATAQAGIAKNLQQAAEKASATGPVDTSTPGFANIGLKTSGETAKFEGPLEQYMKMLSSGSYAAKPQETQQTQQGSQVQDELSAQQQQPSSDYFNYGQQTDIDLAQSPGTDMLYSKAGGLATPLFAGGGTTRHGKYAGGGLNVVEHSGKARIDFRTGNAVTGPGDGQSDDIPAMLADGEFVFPADVVAALGNGSTKAGSDKLYDMMHSIRAYHRSAKPRDLPPPAKKSPLDYLKKRKVRR